MAYILNLETATTNCSVSISNNGELVVLKEHNSPNYSHSEQLHNFIMEALEEVSLSLNNVDAIAVSKGPGSYTGLRIGVSTAKGLCFSLDKPLISLPTLENIALQIKISDGLIIPVIDARRMEVYSAVYSSSHKMLRDTMAEIIDERSFEEFSKKDKVYVIGSGATKCREIIKAPNFNFDDSLIPSAREMCMPAYEKFKARQFEDTAYFEPFYLKDFIGHKKNKS